MNAAPKDPILHNLILAVEDEVAAGRRLNRVYTLSRGARLPSSPPSFRYRFEVENAPRLPDDSSARLRVGTISLDCRISLSNEEGLTVETSVDIGESVDGAALEIDRSHVLSVLLARLSALEGAVDDKSFRYDIAANAFRLSGPEEGEESDPPVGVEGLALDQIEGVRRCLRNRITYLWGPPGTGKTTTLTAVGLNLFRANKRVLVVAHTNRAVDRFLEQLWGRVLGRARGAIPEGSIVRIGDTSGVDPDVEPHVSLKEAASKLKEKVSERSESVRGELKAIGEEIEDLNKKLLLAARRSVLESELSGLQEVLENVRKGEGHLSTVLRVLRVRYGEGNASQDSLSSVKNSIRSVSGELFELSTALGVLTAEELDDRLLEARDRQVDLEQSLNDLEELSTSSELNAIQRARTVGCTTSQAILRSRLLGEFDVVIVDEASMLPLPVVYFMAGLARERVILGGDFRQLPPIALSDTTHSREWFSRDIFEAAGVVDLVEAGRESEQVAVLRTQFRGNPSISKLINQTFYGGMLRHSERIQTQDDVGGGRWWSDRGPLLLVDTGVLAPAGGTEDRSKWNLTNALVTRGICDHLAAKSAHTQAPSIGVITPYRSQGSLLGEMFREAEITLPSVGTIHRFQGSERDIIIVDLTETTPHTLGPLLSAHSPRDLGARLLNVALSRARSQIILVADCAYLQRNLNPGSILGAVIESLEEVGGRVDISDVFSPDTTSQASRSCSQWQTFGKEDFLSALSADLLSSRTQVLVSSAEVGLRSAHVLAAMCKTALSRDIKCVFFQSTAESPNEDKSSIRAVCEQHAIPLVSVSPTAPNLIVIDEEVVWLMTRSPLRSVEDPSLIAVRFVSRTAASLGARKLLPFGETLTQQLKVAND